MDRFLFFTVHSPRKTTSSPWKGRSKGKALGTRLLEKLAWSKSIIEAFQTSVFSRVKINTQAPSTRIRLSLNPQLFLSGYCFRPQVRWIRHTNPPETCGRANSIWIRIRVHVKIFLIRKEKVAHSKTSGYMWTGPCFPVSDKHIENMRLSMIWRIVMRIEEVVINKAPVPNRLAAPLAIVTSIVDSLWLLPLTSNLLTSMTAWLIIF